MINYTLELQNGTLVASELSKKERNLIDKLTEKDIKNRLGWKRTTKDKLHQHGITDLNKKYKKYTNVDGREAVFTSNSLSVNQGPNAGTFNYGPNNVSLNHVNNDILDYYMHGTGYPNDKTEWYDRVTCTVTCL